MCRGVAAIIGGTVHDAGQSTSLPMRRESAMFHMASPIWHAKPIHHSTPVRSRNIGSMFGAHSLSLDTIANLVFFFFLSLSLTTEITSYKLLGECRNSARSAGH